MWTTRLTLRAASKHLTASSRPAFTTSLTVSLRQTPQQTRLTTTRQQSTGKMSFPTPSSDPPKNEMVYFPNMTTSLPSSSGEFRRVLFTGLYSQLVLMTVPVGGDIGDEVHTVDQILTFTSGTGKATIAGTQHQFVNTGPTPLILYTVYSPAEHKPTSVHKTKEEGDKEEDDEIDVPPEWSQKSKAENKKNGMVKGED